MVANFAIQNNPHSAGGRSNQETLRKLAKKVLEDANKKERNINSVVERRSEYTTAQYVPAETYIYSISARACQNNTLKEKVDFLNNQAALKTLASRNILVQAGTEVFEVELDDSKNIFAA